jgi:hypothetical protein
MEERKKIITAPTATQILAVHPIAGHGLSRVTILIIHILELYRILASFLITISFVSFVTGSTSIAWTVIHGFLSRRKK